MPQIGPLEILVVAFIALIVFGPQKLPGMARSAGRGLYELRRAMTDVKREVEAGIEEDVEKRGQPAAVVATTETSPDEEPG